MKILFGRAHIRALAHQIGRQAERQGMRQANAPKINTGQRGIGGRAAREVGQLIVGLSQRFVQGRQGHARLRQCGLLRHHLGA